MVHRYRLLIEYDGTGMAGWQRQAGLPTIQASLEEAISRIVQQSVLVQGAGRTDAGVHALGQVAHVDLPKQYSAYNLIKGCNFYLRPLPIRVLDAVEVDCHFHARFSAKARAYRYRILNRLAPSALEQWRMWHINQIIDHELMQEAASYLVGLHDFSSLRAKACQASSPLKTVSSCQLVRLGDEIQLHIEAPSFLHHMVRNIVGTLVQVGLRRWDPSYIQTILAAKDRSYAGPTAPAHGLYFLWVHYPDSSS
jgi:tRNA pseudouridine38-40 synthase